MKGAKKATSIIEAMIIMLIVVSGVVGMYTVFNESQQLSGTTTNKIQAIQIAREGIEAMKNIRDTNWILFGSDTANCWNNRSYSSACVGKPVATYTTTDIRQTTNIRGYTVYKDLDNRWKLVWRNSTLGFENNGYRTRFIVGLDGNGFYTQSGALIDTTKPLEPLFTREIKINYLDDGQAPNYLLGPRPSNEQKMEVTSLVQWSDSASEKPHKVEFTTVLSNWKK